MIVNFNPPYLNGNPMEQLTQIKSYLNQLTQNLNYMSQAQDKESTETVGGLNSELEKVKIKTDELEKIITEIPRESGTYALTVVRSSTGNKFVWQSI